jgi:serine protease AprX
MTVVMLLVLLMPVFGKAYSVINAQPLLLDLAVQQPGSPVSVIVQKTNSDASLEEEVKRLGGTVTNDLSFINSFVAQLPAGQVPFLASTPGLKWVSLDSPVVKTDCGECMPSDDNSNYTSAVKADKVWNNSANTAPWLQGKGIGVAILDSGVNPALLDFTDPGGTNTRVVSSVKIDKDSPSIDDGNGHGTLVAGVIGSNGDGSMGKNPGIAPQARLVSVKVSDDNGGSSASDVLAGLQWVYLNSKQYNIKVINLSINSSVAQSYNVDPLNAGVEALWFSGITVVVSAGNNGTANLFAPANDPFVITVGAATNTGTVTAPNWTVAPFSAYGKDEAGGSKPDLVAPGTGIISDVANLNAQLPTKHKEKLVGTTYMKVAGTSFAAPQVAGAVALLLQSNPNLTPDQVKYRLKATALKNVPQGAWDTRALWTGYNPTKAGAGFLDIQAAVTQTGITGKANTGIVPSALFLAVLMELKISPVSTSAVNWSSVNWSSVNWSSVNWSSVNWSSVNWSSVNWSSVNWSSVNWSSVNWSSVNWSGIYWDS